MQEPGLRREARARVANDVMLERNAVAWQRANVNDRDDAGFIALAMFMHC
ncbi:MAG: hypothetical protein KY456_06970 [Chloroflexi bacterium]|nr:hypothetical protein [Chloroflexota bacterium]